MRLLQNTFSLILVLFLVACSSSATKVESDLDMDDAPDWVNEGSQALSTDDGRLIHGVGEAPDIGDFSLQKNTADNRARAEVASVIGIFMDNVTKDYSHHKGKSQTVDISRVLKTKTKVLMAGVRIIARWKDSDSKHVYALAELDLEQIKKVVNSTSSFPDHFKNYLNENGDDIFNNYATMSK